MIIRFVVALFLLLTIVRTAVVIPDDEETKQFLGNLKSKDSELRMTAAKELRLKIPKLEEKNAADVVSKLGEVYLSDQDRDVRSVILSVFLNIGGERAKYAVPHLAEALSKEQTQAGEQKAISSALFVLFRDKIPY